MPDPSRLRDSTQIVLPCDELDGLQDDLTDRYALSIFVVGEGYCRIIGSPVEIKQASEYLTRHGINLP